MKYPTFPKSLTPKIWDATAKKENFDAPKASGAVEALAYAYDKTKWDDLDPSTADTDDYQKSLAKALAPVRDAADDALKTLKKFKGDLADDTTSEINKLLKEISAFEKDALSEIKKRAQQSDKDAATDTEDEEDESGNSYSLKNFLKLAKKRPLKFALAKVDTDALSFSMQLFIDKKPPTSKFIAKNYPEYRSPKIITKGLVTFSGGTFFFATKNAPKSAWEKIFNKLFKLQKCAVLGEIALRQLKKGEDPELDADSEKLGDEDSGAADTQAALKQALEKLKPDITKALAKSSGISPADRKKLADLVAQVSKQLADHQDRKVIATIKEIQNHLKTSKETAAVFAKLTENLQKLGADFKKAKIADKRVISEFATLVRNAQHQIADGKEKPATETLRDIQKLLTRASA